MPRALSLTQNSFAVMALFAIITLSVVTTLGLSPVAVKNQGQVAGVSTTQGAKILSNFIPIEVTDANPAGQDYTSQLVQLTQSQYQYTASFIAHDAGTLDYKLVKITNPNTAPVSMSFTANVAREVSHSMNVALISGDTYRVLDSEKTEPRTIHFVVPANDSITVAVNYELLQPISFPFQVSFSINY